MIACADPEFLGFMPPKTGTTSLIRLLRQLFDVEIIGSTYHCGGKLNPRYANWFTFCTVRNPFSRLVSYWWFVRKRFPPAGNRQRWALREMANQLTFSEFTRQSPLLPVSQIVEDARIDHLIRLETYENSIRQLPFLSSQYLAIPRAKKGRDVDWREYYTERSLVEFVQRHYADDFERFGYSTEPF